MTDRQATIVFVNDAGRRLVGLPDEEDLAGVNALQLIARELRAETAEGLRRVLTEGVARNRESLVLRRDSTQEAMGMRLSVAGLRRVVKGDLRIEFTEDRLTSHGGLELTRRYVGRIGLRQRIEERMGQSGVRSD